MQDDTVLDVIEEFKNYLKETQSVEKSTAMPLSNNQEILEDEDEGPLFWLALAKCQWEYGVLEKGVLEQVITDLYSK
jgi:hypothetical protein